MQGRTFSTPEECGLPWDWCARIVEDEDTGCWLWIGASQSSRGYGAVSLNGRQMNAHRAVWVFINGDLPGSVHVDHLCRVPPCVNPHHMEPVSPRVNTQRGSAAKVHRARHAAKTHCAHGHEYSTDNTRVYTYRGLKFRKCKSCERVRSRARRERDG